jgi:hypothetical protein
MNSLTLLLVLVAAFKIGFTAPANRELAEIERLLSEEKDHAVDVSSEDVAEKDLWDSIPSYYWRREKMATGEQSRYPNYHRKKDMKDKAVAKEQWSFYRPQTSLNGEEKAKEEQLGATFPYYGRHSQTAGKQVSENEASKVQWGGYEVTSEELGTSHRDDNTSSRMSDYISDQAGRMHTFLETQTERMRNFVQQERDETLKFMKQERNNTIQFLQSLYQAKATKMKETAENAAEAEFNGSTLPPPPSTLPTETTGVRIPTSWDWREQQDAREIARIQGFLRKIAPYILKKISG